MGIPVLDVVNLARVLKRAAVVLLMSPWLWFSALASSVALVVYALYEHMSNLFSHVHETLGSLWDQSIWDVMTEGVLYRFVIYGTASDVLWTLVKWFIGEIVVLFLVAFVGVFGICLFVLSKKFVSWLGQFFMEV